jgi:hypothetical protein
MAPGKPGWSFKWLIRHEFRAAPAEPVARAVDAVAVAPEAGLVVAVQAAARAVAVAPRVAALVVAAPAAVRAVVARAVAVMARRAAMVAVPTLREVKLGRT